MAKPLTDTERERIADLCRQGKTCTAIAREVGRSPDTISRIARQIGHRFGHTNAARAREARSAYSAERRAELAARFTEEAERLLDQMHQPHLAFNFGGKDNDYNERTLPEPPVEAKRMLMQAAREAIRTVLDIDRHDNRADHGASVVDDWLRSVIGESVQAAAE